MARPAVLCAALFSCLAFTAAAGPASASAAPSPPASTIRVLAMNGSGCPPGTAGVRQGSGPEFTVTYSNFLAAAGGWASPVDFRKNCQVDVSVAVPSGWTYGFSEVDYQGFAYMGTGAQGMLETAYYFTGSPSTYQLQHSLSGSRNGDYKLTNGPTAIQWAPCNFTGTLNLNTSARVSTGSGKPALNGLTMLDSLSTTYHISFMRC